MLPKITLISLMFYLCKTQDLSFRIYGGLPIPIEEAPYSIYFEMDSRSFCGGTILAADVFITAAHCVKTLSMAKVVKCRAGSPSCDNGGTEVGVKGYLMHPEYDSHTWQNDIALVWLDKNLTFSDTIQPVPELPEQNEPVPRPGSKAFVAGWGMMENHQPSQLLRGVYLPIFNFENCRRIWYSLPPPLIEISSRMLCAGYEKGHRDICSGDSGSGLVVNGKLIGVGNFGTDPCGSLPSVFSKVASYRNWIDTHIKYNPQFHKETQVDYF